MPTQWSPEKYRQARLKRKRLGLCVWGNCYCPDKPARGTTLCARHMEKAKGAARERKNKSSALVRQQKIGKPCVDCGQIFPPEAMDFDHIRGTKLHGIAEMAGHNLAAIVEEIKKCVLRCKNCHAIKTHKYQEWNNKRKHANGLTLVPPPDPQMKLFR